MQDHYKIIIFSILGTFLEFYSFNLFPVYAPYFLEDVVKSSLVIYGISLAGYVSRPLGALVIGALADRYNRHMILALTILLTGIISCLIGLSPVNSVLIFIFLRFAQGFMVSGEEGICAIYLYESLQGAWKKYSGSFALFGVFWGIGFGLLSLSVFKNLFGAEGLKTWGWRVPFILCLPLSVFIYMGRKKLSSKQTRSQNIEPLTFKKWLEPLQILFRDYLLEVIAMILFAGIYASLTCFIMVYLPFLYKTMGIQASLSIPFLVFILPFSFLGFNALSRNFSSEKLLLIGSIATFLLIQWIIPNFFVENYNKLIAYMGILILISCLSANLFLFLSESFPQKIRCTAVGFVFNTSVCLFSGLFPVVTNFMGDQMGHIEAAIFVIRCIACISILGFCLYFLIKKGVQRFHTADQLVL